MTKRPLNSNIDPRHLRSELLRHGSSGQIWPDEEARIAQDMLGEILIVEDLTKDVIETLGSVLNIDPLFFAKHLTDSNFTFSDHLTPPSRSWLKGYLNIFYHRVVSIEGQKMPTSSPLQFSRNSNVSRKVVVLPPMGKTKIALVQHCCSILMLTRKDGTWLGLVLCDPPLERDYTYEDPAGVPVNLKVDLFPGGCEDFIDPPSFYGAKTSHSPPSHQSFEDDLRHYWDRDITGCFGERSPSLWALANCPLKIVVYEWSKYATVLYRCIKHFEYSNGEVSDFLNMLRILDSDLRMLQSWRRRIMASEQKLDIVIRFIRAQEGQSPDDKDVKDMLEDYTHLAKTINMYGQRLENMLPVVFSLVQIVDSRRSFAETANISRLTILALIFVPLTFVSSLFSMGGDMTPGGRLFWVYFAVAVPLTLVVFLFAHLPTLRAGGPMDMLRVRKVFLDLLSRPRSARTEQTLATKSLDA